MSHKDRDCGTNNEFLKFPNEIRMFEDLICFLYYILYSSTSNTEMVYEDHKELIEVG